MLFQLAKNSAFLQNLVVNTLCSVHPSIDHNIGKIQLIKKALFHCELEKIEGCYLEFGVFEGTSIYAAAQAHRKLSSNIDRHFYGFDSFDEGFKYFDERDKHPFFKEGDFKSSFEKVKRRVSRFPNVHLIKGYFENTVAGKQPEEICGSDKAAIVFLDCDLMNPALIALNFAHPMLQPGSVLILDDYWAYKGDRHLGTSGALNRYLEAHPSVRVRPYYPYGCGGNSFIVEAI